jgi:hypothetical protein
MKKHNQIDSHLFLHLHQVLMNKAIEDIHYKLSGHLKQNTGQELARILWNELGEQLSLQIWSYK